jgi:hypothetical protein
MQITGTLWTFFAYIEARDGITVEGTPRSGDSVWARRDDAVEDLTERLPVQVAWTHRENGSEARHTRADGSTVVHIVFPVEAFIDV